MKKLLFTQQNQERHWVGDGFPVRTIFSYNDAGLDVSPFLLMDYAGPHHFEPSLKRRGVGEHPHRGFETVTIVYSGQVEHRDSAGGGGVIGPGDVQWMTAASGLVHDEKHGDDFTANGGEFEMVQLWVNLPAKDKAGKPRYQGLLKAQIPTVELPDGAGSLRVIAGHFPNARGEKISGPTQTFTPLDLWDIRLISGHQAEFATPVGHTAAVFVLSGNVQLESGESIGSAELAVLDAQGASFRLTASEDSKILFLGGEAIRESVVGYGPFVMNTQAEIRQAMADYQDGKMGQLVSTLRHRLGKGCNGPQ